jgi:probable phosphoglycerate mutase
MQGHLDPGLNAVGLEQALDLAARLAGDLDPGTPIFTSDLRRAKETARAIADALSSTPRPRKDLRERMLGALEGKTYLELAETHPGEVQAYRSGANRDAIPDIEPLASFERRVLEAVGEIAAVSDPAIVVTHGGALRVLLKAAMGEGKRFAIGNCALYRLRVTEERIQRVV